MGEKNNNYGKHHTEEHRKKISAALKGTPLSEERRKKISESKKGKRRVWDDETHSKFHYE